MATTETASLIRHVQGVENGMPDAFLSRVLGVSAKRLDELKRGEKDGSRAIKAALGILAERVGYGETGFDPLTAARTKIGSHVVYNGEACLVLAVKKSGGPNAPYFALLGESDVYTGISWRFCGPVADADETESEPVKANGRKG